MVWRGGLFIGRLGTESVRFWRGLCRNLSFVTSSPGGGKEGLVGRYKRLRKKGSGCRRGMGMECQSARGMACRIVVGEVVREEESEAREKARRRNKASC
jgi:hypothetical protein